MRLQAGQPHDTLRPLILAAALPLLPAPAIDGCCQLRLPAAAFASCRFITIFSFFRYYWLIISHCHITLHIVFILLIIFNSFHIFFRFRCIFARRDYHFIACRRFDYRHCFFIFSFLHFHYIASIDRFLLFADYIFSVLPITSTGHWYWPARLPSCHATLHFLPGCRHCHMYTRLAFLIFFTRDFRLLNTIVILISLISLHFHISSLLITSFSSLADCIASGH